MSAILSADDLNDFISPGVACIKPVETLPKEDPTNPYEVTTEDKMQAANPAPASISLTDCLACSGCVTSAEAVLVSLQSHAEVIRTLEAHPSLDVRSLLENQHDTTNRGLLSDPNSKVFVASVSPQVRASLAAMYNISEREAGYMIEQFLSGSQGLRGTGQNSSFSYVVDTNRMREVCLVLGADEVGESLLNQSQSRPILTSACPGWICYAEKTHPHVLPHLSKLKSPQALTGTMLKTVLSKKLGIPPSQIWHLAIMPCFDKKLEASREELTDRWWQHQGGIDENQAPVRDVDCVITSRELLTLANDRGIRLDGLPLQPLASYDRVLFPDAFLSRFLFSRSLQHSQPSEAGPSGGYLHHILKTQQSIHPGSSIISQRGRNADIVEYTLQAASHQQIMKCARFYGFRNIQNLVRKLKPNKMSRLPGAARRTTAAASGGSEYAYVEVMACPGGCTNGGGQIRVEDLETPAGFEMESQKSQPSSIQSQKQWLSRVDEAYYSADSESDSLTDTEDEDVDSDDTTMSEESDDMMINGISTRNIHELIHHWSQMTSIPLDRLVYTTFRKVESDVGKSKNMGDTERIAAIAGTKGGGW